MFGDWLFRLTSAAYAQPDVGTATPFTNRGSILSSPRGAGAGCDVTGQAPTVT